MAKKNPTLAVGRGEKLPVSQGAGLTAKGRSCELCGCDISHKRSDARFCCRDHKRKTSDAKRNYAAEYQKNKVVRRKQALGYYYANHEQSKTLARKRQKNNPALYAANAAKYRTEKLRRTPKWLTEDDIWIMQEAYLLASMRTKSFGFSWHVDHVIPLCGKNVSGLHVPTNLQVIPGLYNIAKNNSFEVI